MGFSRQECWSGFPCPPPGDLPDPGLSPCLMSPALAGGFFTTSATWGAPLSLFYPSPKLTPILLQSCPFSRRLSLGEWYHLSSSCSETWETLHTLLSQSIQVPPTHHQVNIPGTCASSPFCSSAVTYLLNYISTSQVLSTSKLPAPSHPLLPLRVTIPRASSDHAVLPPQLSRIPYGLQGNIRCPAGPSRSS